MKTGLHLRVRQLLRDLSNGAFFKEGGSWTYDPEEAKDFTAMKELLETCDRYEIRDAEIVEHVGYGLSDLAAAQSI